MPKTRNALLFIKTFDNSFLRTFKFLKKKQKKIAPKGIFGGFWGYLKKAFLGGNPNPHPKMPNRAKKTRPKRALDAITMTIMTIMTPEKSSVTSQQNVLNF